MVKGTLATSNAPHASFWVIYEGPPFAEHTIRAAELASALMSLEVAFARANFLLNGGKANVDLRIKATAPGSFEYELVLLQVLYGASFALSSWNIASAARLLGAIVGGDEDYPISLFRLLKLLAGRKPKATDHGKNGVLLEAEELKISGSTLEAKGLRLSVSEDVAKLHSDGPLRRVVEEIVRPVSSLGATNMLFRRGGRVLESVAKAEAPYFKAHGFETNAEVQEIDRMRLQITALSFSDGKWRLSDGHVTRWYSMEDKNFLRDIENGKRFGQGDILICTVRITQRTNEDGTPEVEYTIPRVFRHIEPGGEQMSLVPSP